MARDLPDDLEHDHISNYEISDDAAEAARQAKMGDLKALRESYQRVLVTTPVSMPNRVAVVAYVERLEAVLLDLLRLHDAEVFVREPWDITFDEARAALAGEGDEDE